MQRILYALALLLSTSVLAQQQGQPPPTSPPYGTPPTFPREQQQTPGQMPPDQNAPPNGLSNHEAAQQIQQGLKSEPSLRNSDIAVHVDKKSVVLTGTIQDEEQRDVALRIAHSYSGNRQVIDKLKIKQRTEGGL